MGGQRHALAAFTPGKEPVPIVTQWTWGWVNPRASLGFKCSPINNPALMQILQPKNNTGSIKHSSWLCKNICMNVHHQITTSSILHHKAHVCLQTEQTRHKHTLLFSAIHDMPHLCIYRSHFYSKLQLRVHGCNYTHISPF